MIKFWRSGDKMICTYTQERGGTENWAKSELEARGEITLKKTFHFTSKDVFTPPAPEELEENGGVRFDDDFDFENEPVHFSFAKLKGGYFKIKKGILIDGFDIFFHESVEMEVEDFVTDSDISIFATLASIMTKDIYIGGDHQEAVPLEGFTNLLASFPNSYERKKYVQARVTAILREYVGSLKDAEAKYNRYMNKRVSKKGSDLKRMFRDSELVKYETILEKLQQMLKDEDAYSEKQWQEEILQILLLIYPKYIAVFREVPVRGRNMNERFMDYILVDSSGHTDIVEIKRPFGKSIITEAVYRNNYIPLRELSGTIMQIEKYIYYLNRWGVEGEEKLTEKYKDELPQGLSIRITNPGGIIIMGRENNLSEEQKLDFEVVKRKYKNVVDIITYDNLLQRLKSTIEQIKKS
ncbi:Shedu immune nuclease family protein [Terrimonas ferruginea]|uniref:Shedu immune nuclease family protein n=1 Tax=Terrimonas ferruginea TaxID=249 RepID=UPI0004921747|nr:Shedu immune nuclease family protein [Terrimonas ferruginea]